MSEVEPIPNTPEKVWPLVAQMKQELSHLVKLFILESNDGITRQHAENLVKVWLSYKHKTKKIADYAVSCDMFNNTPDVVDKNEMKIDVAVQFCYWDDSFNGHFATTSFIFIPITIGPK